MPFASYPAQTLTPQTLLGLVDADVSIASQRVARFCKLAMVGFANNHLKYAP